ncbi:Hypothetical predicted protein [Olea europaea subsp. europaea]|uniref:Uncharacterized protein n=1 Tax=Olea europaea subsp. europaea TaxID=158383 RepID=A0A8S0PES0_OLEEU|nr:Hypothetical predicted protein [Olea europaea subsp. europaea]
MAGIAATSVIGGGAPVPTLKLPSTIIYLLTIGILSIMNKIRPSQLAEEQRNATRLLKQLYSQIQTITAMGNPTTSDVKEMMEKVLALDKAYPLPLLGAMLEKFPKNVEPTVWWEEQRRRQAKGLDGKKGALASVVNTIEHGGQVGMVFEMYRSNAGFFKLMEESIESNLTGKDMERRENGELFEMKVALQLGRSLSQVRDLADSSSRKAEEKIEEFASKLF